MEAAMKKYRVVRISNGVEFTKDCESRHASLQLASKRYWKNCLETCRRGLSDVWAVYGPDGQVTPYLKG
jgi:hypothetical protein